ncbi:uncharacterized protein LOC129794127 [Lutzomyia longipalpis]|uniref:uncharacterized protein LOC129794127 n=1 Tax=Lutzomyia longipalpis TaxID=7200 RepID=UPI002484099A|nr:uncharacterized protein LOC129794127 [Lutzomyia longipalpis]
MEDEAINLTVINEEIRSRKHTMRLCLGSDSDDKNAVAVDQTPTPTRLIRNCEEVGLFEDLKHVNPFEETFRRAVEDAKTPSETLTLPEAAVFDSTAKIVCEDTLHTPQIFPSNYFPVENHGSGPEKAETATEKEEKVENVRKKRNWMPQNWKPEIKVHKAPKILPKFPTSPQILQPAIIIPPTVIVKCVSPSVLVQKPPESTSSIVKNRLKILCREQVNARRVMKEKEGCEKVPEVVVAEKKVTKRPNVEVKDKGNCAAVKRYRAKLKSYQDFLKENNQKLQDENVQLKLENDQLRDLLRKHNISIPEELISSKISK